MRQGTVLQVRTIGTRAPSTMPATAASARYTSCFTSRLPASRSGTTGQPTETVQSALRIEPRRCFRLDKFQILYYYIVI